MRPAGPGLDLDPGREQVLGLDETQATGASGEQHREQALEVPGDIREGLGEDAHDLLVDGTDDSSELPPSATDVLELLGKKPVPLFECSKLLERERVHRAHQPELAIKLAYPGLRRNAGRQLGTVCRDGLVRLALELPAQCLDCRLQPEPRLGAFKLDPLKKLALRQ